MTLIQPGRLYAAQPDGTLEDLARDLADGPLPDVWICRRLADYPGGTAPAGAALAWCAGCGRPIAYNPVTPVPATIPKRCLQCCGIAPLPLEAGTAGGAHGGHSGPGGGA